MKEGWEPLCQFLGLPIPEEPFPNVNDKAEVQRVALVAKCLAYGLFVAAPVLISAWALKVFL